MAEVTGTIKKIKKITHPKRKVEIQLRINNKETAFIEFQSDKMIKEIQRFKEGCVVSVGFLYKGKISKKGIFYNNIVAKNILYISN